MSAPIVRLMNTIRPSEVTEAAASSVVPNVARCGVPLTRQLLEREGNLPHVRGVPDDAMKENAVSRARPGIGERQPLKRLESFSQQDAARLRARRRPAWDRRHVPVDVVLGRRVALALRPEQQVSAVG